MNRYGITETELKRVYEADMNGGWLDNAYENDYDNTKLTCEQVIEMSGLSDISVSQLILIGEILEEDDELYLYDEVILIADPSNIKEVY